MHWLEENNFRFPYVEDALLDPNCLLTARLTITPDLVLDAYSRGIFQWYSEDQPVLWWSPNPRCVLYPRDFHISRSLKQTLNRGQFEIRTDTAFREVMLSCAAPRINRNNSENIEIEEPGLTGTRENAAEGETNGTWITPAMVDVYCQLHEAGFAHSVECWHRGELAGGMYGLVFGDMFFGESMFSRMQDASKVAMHHICTKIQPFFVDAQVRSEHLISLGAEEIERQLFTETIRDRLHKKLCLNTKTGAV